MKNTIVRLIIGILIIISLISCNEKKIVPFKITIILTQDLGCKAGDPLNSGIKSLISYYLNSACPEKVYVPAISFIRTDFSPEKNDTLAVALSSLNNWRKSLNLLSASNLMEDYDEKIPELKTPAILCDKSDKIGDSKTILQKYPSSMIVNVGDSMILQIEEIKNLISKSICEKNKSEFTILFLQSNTASVPQSIIVDPIDTINRSKFKHLETVLNDIGTQKFSFEQRLDLIKPTLNELFAKKSIVRVVGHQGTFVNNQTAEQYLGSISGYVTLDSVQVLETRLDKDNKIYLLVLKEFHSATYKNQ